MFSKYFIFPIDRQKIKKLQAIADEDKRNTGKSGENILFILTANLFQLLFGNMAPPIAILLRLETLKKGEQEERFLLWSAKDETINNWTRKGFFFSYLNRETVGLVYISPM